MFWLKILCLATVGSLARAQIWDILYGDYEDEAEDDAGMYADEYYIDENATYVLVMNSAQIRSDRALYDESNDIILDEVNFLLDDPEPFDTEHVDMTAVDELITENTLKLFNILQETYDLEEPRTHRISFNDVFIWSNVSETEINDMLEEYYSEG